MRNPSENSGRTSQQKYLLLSLLLKDLLCLRFLWVTEKRLCIKMLQLIALSLLNSSQTILLLDTYQFMAFLKNGLNSNSHREL
jgi:hypothetical protein